MLSAVVLGPVAAAAERLEVVEVVGVHPLCHLDVMVDDQALVCAAALAGVLVALEGQGSDRLPSG
jgi:hypothetical protein